MLNNLRPTSGSRKENKRRCRGIGSGIGKNGGTGNKGQKSRGTGKVNLGFEGGQLPLLRRLPKRGFKNVNRVEYAVVNLDVLETFENNSTVDLVALVSKGYINKELAGLKVLGNGKLTKTLEVKAKKFSNSAKEAIEACGGKAIVE